jgi:hypothetical protein
MKVFLRTSKVSCALVAELNAVSVGKAEIRLIPKPEKFSSRRPPTDLNLWGHAPVGHRI